MTLPSSEPLSSDESRQLPPGRRRHRRRLLLPSTPDAKAAFAAELARRVTPSGDFYLFSALASVLLGCALIFDSPALFILAALIAPFLGPVMGLALASVAGSNRFFGQALGGMSIAAAIIFALGAAAGGLQHFLPASAHMQAPLHTVFTIPDTILLTIGAALATYLIVRLPEQRPLVASVALAYELYLPLGTAGYGLTAGLPGLFPEGLMVFVVHLAWAVLVSTVTLAVLGLRPFTLLGYTVASSLGLIILVALIAFSGFGAALTANFALPPTHTLPPPTPTVTTTPTLTGTPAPPTSTPTKTLIPTRTATGTLTPVPTPVWARVYVRESNGAVVRAEPDFNSPIVTSLNNGSLVIVLPDTATFSGVLWAHIRMEDNREGWIVQNFLQTATPKPGW